MIILIMEIRTRMAPSPTGFLHLGTAYTTLFNFLFARHNKGKFILRIEDTDQERSKKEYEENILDGLKWLGLIWDEGPFYQMQLLLNYGQAAERLLEEGSAYYCFCTKEELDAERALQQVEKLPLIYSGRCRLISPDEALHRKNSGQAYVIRHKMPEERGIIEFDDIIHGKISFDSKLIGDTIIMRQNGIPLYNFAVVVDDVNMQITHVLRSEDHISNTPKQVVIFEALKASLPQFAHWPVVLNSDRMGKLSKRAGATSIDFYREEGYLPEAMINYLALLGWTHPEGKEIFTLDEMIQSFDLKDINQSAAAWNEQKLDWINGEYIRAMSDEELVNRLRDFLPDHPTPEKIQQVIPLVKERMKKLSDFVALTDFLFLGSEYDLATFERLKLNDPIEVLKKVLEKMEQMPIPWESEKFAETFRQLAQELSLSNTDMFQLIRVAFSGKLVTPPLFECMQLLSEQETKKRIQDAITFLSNEPTMAEELKEQLDGPVTEQ